MIKDYLKKNASKAEDSTQGTDTMNMLVKLALRKVAFDATNKVQLDWDSDAWASKRRREKMQKALGVPNSLKRLTEILGNMNPLNLLGAPIAIALAGGLKGRTKEEQVAYEKGLGGSIANLFLPGAALYNRLKSEEFRKAYEAETREKHMDK